MNISQWEILRIQVLQRLLKEEKEVKETEEE